MSHTDSGRDLASNAAFAAASVVMTALIAIDLATDAGSGTTAFHVVVEGAMIAIGVVAAVRLAMRVRELTLEARELREHARELTANLDASRQDAARWRRDAGDLIAGLSEAIDRQLEHWSLSPAEKAVALLLLKGLSHKEIAVIREVNETTVRQQARAIYRKAGLSGRNDLAAFFLEDLLGPREVRTVPAATSGAAAKGGDLAPGAHRAFTAQKPR